MQGDKEQALHLPVSPLMDRSQQGGMTRSQVTLSLLCPLHLATTHAAVCTSTAYKAS